MIWRTNNLAMGLSLTSKKAQKLSKPYDKEGAQPTTTKSQLHTAVIGHGKRKMEL